MTLNGSGVPVSKITELHGKDFEKWNIHCDYK
jgi:hypothetical protein